MAETWTADSWLYGVLAGDTQLMTLATGGVYGHNNPIRPTFPYILFQLQAAAADVMGVGPARIMTPLLYLVRGINEGNTFGGNLKSIADRIDALLQANHGTVTGGVVVGCVRERPFVLPEVAGDGRQFRHMGGLYRIWVQ